MIRILLVEDDIEIRRSIKYYLAEAELYEIVAVDSAEEALKRKWENFHLILLDIMLPDMNGIELCREFRKIFQCPILFITCLDDTDTIVNALRMGGDDYIVKPFDNQVLEARIQANLRRVRMEHDLPEHLRLQSGSMILDPQKQALFQEGKEIPLSHLEYRLLAYMMEHRGEYFESQELYRILWGNASNGDCRTVVVHIYNLRKKIEKNPLEPEHLINVRGKGYSWV